ncbi:histidine phosphatase family protein [Mesorhizobium sp. NZP2077]|uniref:histidine phosphatase family protein n=1 Tax=Mesorhizobium sp. NZP2077 TaxID=2483404 RepID=UPI001554EA9D|nr:histidine phosphatase family protein [Mesorhizobium sp. NZP2077]QKC85305.1 histidine phosphatase family protein [Mesorhizobium sp. NZP2077]QKD18945.1 histidine phosphatase family protein [Mesorhizobium sp. NZP2077]
MVKRLLFAMRHGETQWNAEGRFQGRSDHSLAVAGRRQATENGGRLKAHFERLGVKPARIAAYTSPLKRARETIAMAALEVGIAESQVNIDVRLAEASFGRWEGMTTLEVKARFPTERRQRKADRWNFDSHDGNSYADLARLMESFLADLDPEQPVLVVSHTGNIRVMAFMLAGLTRDEAMALAVPHDAVLHWDGRQFTWI